MAGFSQAATSTSNKQGFKYVQASMARTRQSAKTLFNGALSPLYRTLNALYRKQNVAMLHTGRCGSQVLGDMLNQHPRIFWDGEIFHQYMKDRRPKSPHFAERTITTSRCQQISAIYGFETKYLPHQHLSDTCINMALEEYLRLLRYLGFTKFIVLHRQNYLRRSISVEVLIRTRQPHSHNKASTATKVFIDVHGLTRRKPLLELFRSLDEQYATLIHLLSSDETLLLSYEQDILRDPKHAYRKVCDFLGILDAHPHVTLKRTNPFPYEELIENLGDVQAALQNTKYRWMLDD